MDWVTWKKRGMEGIQKFKFVLLILLVGIFLMILPGEKSEPTAPLPQAQVQTDLQSELNRILSRVEGAGQVEVLLTESAGARKLFQTDENSSVSESARDVRRDTVLVTNGSREEEGLVQQVLPPTYQGAIVLCQGAGDARVRLAIVNAVAGVTGLGSDKITVLKMK